RQNVSSHRERLRANCLLRGANRSLVAALSQLGVGKRTLSGASKGSKKSPPLELWAEVGDGLRERRRRIVGGFEPPLLQQRSDTPCRMLTSSSCFSQGRLPIR